MKTASHIVIFLGAELRVATLRNKGLTCKVILQLLNLYKLIISRTAIFAKRVLLVAAFATLLNQVESVVHQLE